MKRFILFFIAVLTSWMSFAQINGALIGVISQQGGSTPPSTLVDQYYTFDGTSTAEFIVDDTTIFNGISGPITFAVRMGIEGVDTQRGIIGELTDANDIKWEIDADDNRMDVALTQGAVTSAMTNVSWGSPDKSVSWRFFTYDGTNIGVYEQGTYLLKSQVDSDFVGWTADQVFTIGSAVASNNHMNGSIWDVQVYNRGLSVAEMEQIATDRTNTPSGLIANWADNKTETTWTDEVAGYTAQSQGAGIGFGVPASFKWDQTGGIARGDEFDLNESNVQDISWAKDGSVFWTIGATNDNIKEWTTDEPYRILGSTNTATFSVATWENVPTGLWWHPSGDYYFITGLQGDDINRFDVSTSWDILTSTHTAVSPAEGGGWYGLEFEPDGLHVWCAYSSGGWFLNRYTLTTAWDVTTLDNGQERSASFGTDKISNFGWNEDGFQLWGAIENTGMMYTWTSENQYDFTNKTLVSSNQTVYLSNLRAGEMIPGRKGLFYLGGSGSNVEMKEYWNINEIVTQDPLNENGDFASDTYWSKNTGWSISGGTAKYDGTGGTSNLYKSNLQTIIDADYLVQANVIDNNGSGTNQINIGNGVNVEIQHLPVSVPTTWSFVSTSTGVGTFQIYGRSGEVFELDDFNASHITDVNTEFPTGDATSPGSEEGSSITEWLYRTVDLAITLETTDVADGVNAISIENTSGAVSCRAEHDFALEDGETYNITIWAKKVSGAESTFTAWLGFDNFTPKPINTTAWKEYKWEGLVANGISQTLRAYPSGNSGSAVLGDEIIIDRVIIEKQ